MAYKDKLQELLHRELTRKEFVQVMGLMILSVFGIGGILANLDKATRQQAKSRTEDSDAYGVTSYGG